MVAHAAERASAPTRREQQRTATRERLYESALEEFERAGFADAQIDAIARQAGVVRGTFYFHFPSKEHVLLEMQDRFSRRIADDLEGLAGTDPSLEQIVGRLAEAIEALSESSSPELVRDMLSAFVRTSLIEEPATVPPLHQRLVELFEDSARRGELRRDIDAHQLAVLLLSSLFGVLLSQTLPRHGAGPELRALMRVMLQGLRAG